MSVYDIAHNLARSIKESEEYEKYKEARENILGDSQGAEMLQDYQKLEMKVYSAQMTGGEPDEGDKEKYEKLGELISLNQNIQKYLEAERQMAIMLQDVQKIITQDLELGLGFEGED